MEVSQSAELEELLYHLLGTISRNGKEGLFVGSFRSLSNVVNLP